MATPYSYKVLTAGWLSVLLTIFRLRLSTTQSLPYYALYLLLGSYALPRLPTFNCGTSCKLIFLVHAFQSVICVSVDIKCATEQHYEILGRIYASITPTSEFSD